MAHYRENMATARNTTQSLRIVVPWYTTTIQFFTSNFSVNFSIQTTSRPHPDRIQTASRPHPGSLDSQEFICSGFIGELSPVYCCLVDCFFFFWKFVTKLLILRAKICNDYWRLPLLAASLLCCSTFSWSEANTELYEADNKAWSCGCGKKTGRR